MINIRISPIPTSEDKLFPIPTHRGSFFFSSGEHWQTAEILKLDIISSLLFSAVKMKRKNIFHHRRVVADTCHLLFKLQFCATLLNFNQSLLVFRCCKLDHSNCSQTGISLLNVDKAGRKVCSSEFSYCGGYFFGNMLNQKDIYLPSRVQSKHICQLTLWMCMWIEDINLNPQCKELCS